MSLVPIPESCLFEFPPLSTSTDTQRGDPPHRKNARGKLWDVRHSFSSRRALLRGMALLEMVQICGAWELRYTFTI